MPKPAQLPVWATDLTNNTEPTSGQKATGWVANQLAVSSYFNWLFYTIYLWIAYLDAGLWDDDLEVSGTLNASGQITAQGDLQVDGNIYHGTRHRRVAFDDGDVIDVAGGTASHTAGYAGITIPDTVTALYLKLPSLNSHERLTSVSVFMVGNATLTMSLLTAAVTVDGIYSGVTGASGITFAGGFTLTPTTPVSGDRVYVLLVQPGAGAGNATIMGADIYWDAPA